MKLDARCPANSEVHMFGEHCAFLCHCEKSEKCDETTGKCAGPCAGGWMGPGCQFRKLTSLDFIILFCKNYYIIELIIFLP